MPNWGLAEQMPDDVKYFRATNSIGIGRSSSSA